MATKSIRALSAIITQKSIAELQSTDTVIFGKLRPAADFILDYYQEHLGVPSARTVEEHFGSEFVEQGLEDSIKYYLNELREDFVSRNVQNILEKSLDSVSDVPPHEIMSKVSGLFDKLSAYTNQPKDVSVTNPDYAVDAVMQDIANKENGQAGIKTGIPGIDDSLPDGIGEGHLIAAFGYSGKGKTYLVQKIIANAYEQGKRILNFSLEMSEQDQRKRLYTILSKGDLNLTDFSGTSITQGQMEHFAGSKLNNMGDIIVTAAEKDGQLKPMHIKSKIQKYTPDLVVVDYIQLMSDNAGSEGMIDRIRNVIKELRLLATTTGVPILMISSVTDKEGSSGRKKAPTIDQIAWSRQIEYDATLAFSVHYDNETNIMTVYGQKNRFGPLFAVELDVDFNAGTFEPVIEGFGDTNETV